jgi:hypothetical protein
MTPKEKAHQIHLSMCYAIKTEETEGGFYSNTIHAKNAALIAVDELIEALHEHHWQNRLIIDYWQEVKQEIEKL